jgi:DNA mismatch repair protein MutS
MVEMMETARILRQAGRHSVVILDEIGRGTSTFDGLSLAWAVVEDLVQRAGASIRTLFATHYHELTALDGRLAGVHNMNIAIREWGGDIIFLRRLVPGPSDRSYGIEVAKLAGVPASVVQRAKKILEHLEASRNGGNQRENIQRELIPGLTAPEQLSSKAAPLLSPLKREAPHPLCTTLRDLDTNHLTPMQALALISEWKTLWGGDNNESSQ